jgi:hypothetical protein
VTEEQAILTALDRISLKLDALECEQRADARQHRTTLSAALIGSLVGAFVLDLLHHLVLSAP